MNYTSYFDSDKALDEIHEFLFSNRKEHILEGGAGTGKSVLITELINVRFPQYQEISATLGLPTFEHCYLTATTNVAAEMLSASQNKDTKVSTVHSLFHILLEKNMDTGTYEYDTDSVNSVEDALIIIDEASMIDPKLHKIILDNSTNSKILYVGDWKQLLGVKGTLPNYDLIQKSYLTEIKRTSSPVLKKLYENMRVSVETNTLPTITLCPGVVDWMHDADEIVDFIVQNAETAAITAYTNSTVNTMNSIIREHLGYGSLYAEGEKVLILNPTRYTFLQKEQEVIIKQVGVVQTEHVSATVPLQLTTVQYRVTYKHKGYIDVVSVTVPVDMDEYIRVLKHLRSNRKTMREYFQLKDSITELRPRYASTCHKLQGASKEIILVSLTDIFTCRKFNDILRMLYVSVSRAKSRVIFFGDIPSKYAKLIQGI